jgi:diketogulonate reductase-like aldo/keto reductase
MQLHPFNQQRPIVEYCRQHGIVVAAFCPLVRGKMDEPALVEIAKKANPVSLFALPRKRLIHVVARLRACAGARPLVAPKGVRALRLAPCDVSPGFTSSFVPLPKSATPARIRSNADVFGFELALEDMAALDALDQGKAGSCSWNPVDAD